MTVLLHLVILRSSSLLMLTVLISFNPIMIHLTIKIPAAHIYWHFPHARRWAMAVLERAGTRSLVLFTALSLRHSGHSLEHSTS